LFRRRLVALIPGSCTAKGTTQKSGLAGKGEICLLYKTAKKLPAWCKSLSSAKLFSSLLKLPALFIAAAIWILSSRSTLPQLKGILGWDKLLHFMAYSGLAFCAGLWVPAARWKSRGLFFLLLIAAISSAYGIVDEIHQSFVPGRSPSVWDWAADTLGAFAGTGVVFAVSVFVIPPRSGEDK
jgi:VanZ family protein